MGEVEEETTLIGFPDDAVCVVATLFVASNTSDGVRAGGRSSPLLIFEFRAENVWAIWLSYVDSALAVACIGIGGG